MSLPGPARIIVTQGEGAQGSLAAALGARGAEIVALPTILIEPPEDPAPLDRALSALDRYDWILFTSRHAVEAVAARSAWEAGRARALPALRVAAVGRATAGRLREIGILADVVPSRAGGGALAEAVAAAYGRSEALPGSLTGVRVLWPRSEIALRELPDALARAGASLEEPIAYRTVVPEGADVAPVISRLEEGSIDAIAFLSPSSAKNLPALLGLPDLTWIADRTAVASIGPSTSEALRELGAEPSVESSERTAEDLAESLLSWFSSRATRASRSLP